MSDDFRWLVGRQIPHLRRYAVALTGDADVADDLVQDCLERALRKQHQWRRQGSIRSWLFRILYRLCLDHFRRPVQKHVDVSSDVVEAELVEQPNQDQRLECSDIEIAISRLPETQRAVLLLAALEGLPYDEIAEIVGAPIGTVRSRLSRARETLRQSGAPLAFAKRVKLRAVK